MLILLEGPDCAGKSTLAKRLADELRWSFPDDPVSSWHAGPPDGHPLDEYVKPLLGYRPHANEHVVCDRWHWGERVYPAVFDRETAFDDAAWRYTELFLQSRGALVVHVTGDEHVLIRRLWARGDELVKVGQLKSIRNAFYRVMHESILTTTLCYNEPTLKFDVEIFNLASNLEYATAHLAPFRTYVGHPRPQLLLLGDVRGKEYDPVNPWPAFIPYGASSGRYLLRALTHLQESRSLRLGIANACDGDDVRQLHDALGRPQVVTLGANARDRANELGLRARHAPHPQFVRRFYHARVGDYARQVLLGTPAAWDQRT